ncbi:MAG: STAS domain-containing protein, partial [Fibrobacterota bacterium]
MANGVLEIQKDGKKRLFRLSGDADIDLINLFSCKINEILESNPDSIITIDMRDVDYIDSAALGVLITIVKNLAELDRYLYILRPSSFVEEIFSQTNIDTLVRIAESEEDLYQLMKED